MSRFEPETRPSLRFDMKRNSMFINMAAMNALGNKPFVRFLWDESSRALLIEGCEKRGKDCFPLVSVGRDSVFRRKVFADAIRLRVGWDRGRSYKVYGTLAPKINMLVFSLEGAEALDD